MDKPELIGAARYKFKEVRVYASDEWMANATKKYRTVYDKMETTYIYGELSFYNKLFDEMDWETSFNIKAISLDGDKRTELCNLDSKRTIKMDENIVYVREGWGNETPGMFWKKGDYIWEAYIDDVLVGSQKFHIEDVGCVTIENNPYFDISSLRLYTGGFDGLEKDKRVYLKKINRAETKYLWVEFSFKNKTSDDWFCELFFNFYDDAGQLKGQVSHIKYIEKDQRDMIISVEEGWGSNTGGSWKDDKYTVEMVFMDTLIAVAPFESGTEAVEGDVEIFTTSDMTTLLQKTTSTEPEKESLEEVMKKIEELIGLEEIKKKIKDHVSYLNFIKLRKEKGFEDSEKMSLHSVFTGNPGTGKTTVVKMLGKIYKHMGLLSKGHVLEVDRTDLVGEFIGQTAPKVKQHIDEARGGILFIDEAYSLARENDDSKDFGKEVIEILLREMSDGKGDIAIMVAGYPKEMGIFLDSNPGMKSRFNYYFHFDDYLPEELFSIAMSAAEKRSIIFSDASKEIVKKAMVDAYRDRDRTFGNARYAYSVVDEAKINLGLRLMCHPDVQNLSNEMLSTIETEDVEKIFKSKKGKHLDLAVDEAALRDSMAELNKLVGIKNIKDEIDELIKLVSYYRETGRDVLNKFSLHSVFVGNPGTGKTTVARIIGKIYKSLGLLEKGHIVECEREALVAGFVGQTAIKTKAKIDEARDGILFIDEAYSLADGSKEDFGREAIEVILKNMEDMRGRLSVIVAGYPDNMHQFLESNPGLKSRFDRTFAFNDYSPEELYDIALIILGNENLKPDAAAEEHLRKYIQYLFDKRDKYFGNARSIRQLAEEAIKHQNLRMASTPSAQRTAEMLCILTMDDVSKFVPQEQQNRGSIGFKH